MFERWSEVLRLNVIKAIVEPILTTPATPTFRLGAGAIVTAGHKIDFTDRVASAGAPSSVVVARRCGHTTASRPGR